MRNLFEELRKRLAQGFFPDNFLTVARLADEASWQVERPLGFYVLTSVLVALAADWPEQGISSSIAEDMQYTMEPAIFDYLAAAASRELTAEDEASYLNKIIRAFLNWRSAYD